MLGDDRAARPRARPASASLDARDDRAPGASTAQRPVGLPRWVYVPALVGAAFVLLPLVAIARQVDWGDLRHAHHLRVLARGALAEPAGPRRRARCCASLFGVPMALVLARRDFPGPGRAALVGPAAARAAAGGGRLALLYTFGRRGLLGTALDALGVQIAFSTIAVVMAQTFVAMPFLVVSAWKARCAPRASGTRSSPPSLGARPTTVFRRITLPLVLPGLVSGAVLSFARSLGEFGATITFAGSLQGRTRTLPLEIYLQRETDPDAAVRSVAGAGRRRGRS